MRIKIHLIYLLAAIAIFGCSSGSKKDTDSSGGGSFSSNGCPIIGDLTVTKPSSFGNPGLCVLSGTLTQNATVPSGQVLIIDPSIDVGSGTSSPTLTIQAGAIIEAVSNAAIYVSPGASLRAIGTPTKPIIFSSRDVGFNLDQSDGWGGIIIEDSIATSSASRLEYVIVAEAGQPVTPLSGGSDFAAGISLLGEHETTVLKNVQVHDTVGDGINLDGNGGSNAARLESVLITGAGRDGIHYTNFSGLIKDTLVIHRQGVYALGANVGGRAGIRAGGANSLPLIVNVTLVGNDVGSETANGTDNDEMGLRFEDATIQIRLANTVIVNFRNGCYSIGSDVDLSGLAVDSPPDSNFIDGVHCVNELSGNANRAAIIAGGIDMPVELGAGAVNDNVNGPGLRFYEGVAAIFKGEVNSAEKFTQAWVLDSIGGLANGGNSGLRLYNGGDTNGDSVIDTDDENATPFLGSPADPLFSGVPVLGGIRFFCGDAPADLPADATFVNPTTEVAIVPQPAGLVCGFIKISSVLRGFNLTEIGAIGSGSNAVNNSQFDGWTLQDGAVSSEVEGFRPADF